MKTKSTPKSSIHSFRARSMRDALNLVRERLGPQAQVLHTREVDPGVLGRLWKNSEVEVVAREATPKQQEPQPQPPASAVAEPTPAENEKVGDTFRSRVTARLDELQEMTERLEHVASCDDQALRHGVDHTPSLWGEERRRLDACGVEQALADAWIREAAHRVDAEHEANPDTIHETIVGKLSESLHVSGPIQLKTGERRVVALVGPTGVGKTTTLAKLAAGFRLQEKRRVGLITLDTYRIAAVDQLRTYAQIMDLPIEVAATPCEVRDALDRLRNCELVLIDSAGRSPSDAVRLQEMKTLLQEARPHETHLVLSATTSPEGLEAAAEQFESLGPDALVLTKTDESPKLGRLSSFLVQSDLPISYLTDGQDVPDDIRLAEPRMVAERLLSEGGAHG